MRATRRSTGTTRSHRVRAAPLAARMAAHTRRSRVWRAARGRRPRWLRCGTAPPTRLPPAPPKLPTPVSPGSSRGWIRCRCWPASSTQGSRPSSVPSTDILADVNGGTLSSGDIGIMNDVTIFLQSYHRLQPDQFDRPVVCSPCGPTWRMRWTWGASSVRTPSWTGAADLRAAADRPRRPRVRRLQLLRRLSRGRPVGSSPVDVRVVDHPLAAARLTTLRDERTDNAAFRAALRDLTLMLVYEATRDAPRETVTVRTPLAETAGTRLAKPPLLVPVLRAGLGMVDSGARAATGGSGGVRRRRPRRGDGFARAVSGVAARRSAWPAGAGSRPDVGYWRFDDPRDRVAASPRRRRHQRAVGGGGPGRHCGAGESSAQRASVHRSRR